MQIREAYRRIAMMEVASDELAFAWAVREQESLWLAHDHAFLAAVQGGQPDDAAIRTMLRTYGLLRGDAATLLAGDGTRESNDNSQNRLAMLQIACHHDQDLIADDAKANFTVWRAFGRELAQAFEREIGEQDLFMKSATSKILWFHQPEIVPMYDRFAAGYVGGQPVEYYSKCYALLEKHRLAIAAAKQVWGSCYPFDIRILDKFLWIRGKGKSGKEILCKFLRGSSRLSATAN